EGNPGGSLPAGSLRQVETQFEARRKFFDGDVQVVCSGGSEFEGWRHLRLYERLEVAGVGELGNRKRHVERRNITCGHSVLREYGPDRCRPVRRTMSRPGPRLPSTRGRTNQKAANLIDWRLSDVVRQVTFGATLRYSASGLRMPGGMLSSSPRC